MWNGIFSDFLLERCLDQNIISKDINKIIKRRGYNDVVSHNQKKE